MLRSVKSSMIIALYGYCLILNEQVQYVRGGECKGRGHKKHQHHGEYEVKCKDGEVVGKMLKEPEIVGTVVDQIFKQDEIDNPSIYGDKLDDGGLHFHTDEWIEEHESSGLRGAINNGTKKASEMTEEESGKLNSPCGKNDFIYNLISQSSRVPVVEYEKPSYLEEDQIECPDFLCNKKYPMHRIVQFYYPSDEAMIAREEYINFGRSLTSLIKESTGEVMSVHAVSCCANTNFCMDNNVLEYPTFKVIRKGTDYNGGYSAVFAKSSFKGSSSIKAVKGVYDILYPKDKGEDFLYPEDKGEH